METITLVKKVGTQTLKHKVTAKNYNDSKAAYDKDGWKPEQANKKEEPTTPQRIKVPEAPTKEGA